MDDSLIAWTVVCFMGVLMAVVGMRYIDLLRVHREANQEAERALKVSVDAALKMYRMRSHAVAMANMLAVVLDGMPEDRHADIRTELRNRMNDILPPVADRTDDLDAGEVPVCQSQLRISR